MLLHTSCQAVAARHLPLDICCKTALLDISVARCLVLEVCHGTLAARLPALDLGMCRWALAIA
eukprot:13167495-Alexandrium_andersonii.AAC.1